MCNMTIFVGICFCYKAKGRLPAIVKKWKSGLKQPKFDQILKKLTFCESLSKFIWISVLVKKFASYWVRENYIVSRVL